MGVERPSDRHADPMDNLREQTWHHVPAEEVATVFRVDADKGLDEGEVAKRRERFGLNQLTAKKGESPIILFLKQFHQPLVYILISAGVVTAVLQEWVDSSVIFGVVIVNAIIGFVQEAKALRAIDALSRSMSTEATVVREGDKRRIAANELVPGDVVLLQSGDRVPADLRLVRTRELNVDESALTGESVPVAKSPRRLEPDIDLGDRGNMAYSSTVVTSGTGTGIVTSTGDDTQIGRINKLIASAEVLATPLTRKISDFSRVLLYVILGLSVVTFVVGLLRGESWVAMFMATVALAVGAIPEGLPAAVTITLAIGVSKMAKQHAIIRRLPAVETLGSTTVICTDKTGTLTQNQMTVVQLVAAGETFRMTGVGYAPHGQLERDGEPVEQLENEALRQLITAGVLCNDARVGSAEENYKIEGDPTEAALLVAGQKAGIVQAEIRTALPHVDEIPFESEYQYMATLHEVPGREQRIVYLKGSTEAILARCSQTLAADGSLVPFDAERIEAVSESMAAQGLRVLAFARGECVSDVEHIDHRDVKEGLVFLGLQAMIDPARPEATAAVKACQGAGIAVKMITGDHARTASAIAQEIGLMGERDGSGQLVALTGHELAKMNDEELARQAQRVAVFARVAPEQKLRLVQALQSQSHVVAMTGDGVNDAPALRSADIGVAMGITGTEASKEAADMVLADDNFASIESAVEEGRGVYDNLVKFITWTLPTNLGEGLVILVAVFAGLQLPILPVQILWINMTTAVLLGLMLAFEPKEPRIMERQPRHPKAPILTRPLIVRIVLVGALLLAGSFGLFQWELMQNEPLEVARTVSVNVFVFGEIFYLFNCRSLQYSMFRLGVFTNRWVLGGVALTILLQLGFTYLPFMHRAFGTAPIGLDEWIWILATGVSIYGVIGLEKLITSRHENPVTKYERRNEQRPAAVAS